jgi:hypothetical protein
MKVRTCLVLAVAAILLAAPTTLAEDDAAKSERAYAPWDRAFVQLGGFLMTTDSGFRIGSSNLGLGIDLNVEKFLGLKQTNVAFRFDGGWRFTKNGRHALAFSWFSLKRSGENVLTEDITVPPDDEVILEGTTIDSIFNFDIFKTKYAYSFLLDDRMDLRVGGGLYVMPLEYGLGVRGETKTRESITAPLPVVSFGLNFALSRKWSLRQEVDFLYLAISDFVGSITDFNFAVEWRAWKRVALGLGIESLDIEIQSSSDSGYPGISFDGKIAFRYTGLQFYVRGNF